jgi:GntR family transcriptional regulator/MocR family aminotransferase
MRTLYAARRQALLQAARDLPLEIQSPEAGIHCVGWLPNGVDDRDVVSRAADYDLNLTSISTFCMEPLERKGLLLGYGGYQIKEIRKAVRRLGDLLRSI